MSVDTVAAKMSDMSEDSSLPSNVREKLEEAVDKLTEEDRDLSVRVNAVGSILDQISNDPNIRQHTRTKIWNLASEVESLEE